jgi:hypothetical protein
MDEWYISKSLIEEDKYRQVGCRSVTLNSPILTRKVPAWLPPLTAQQWPEMTLGRMLPVLDFVAANPNPSCRLHNQIDIEAFSLGLGRRSAAFALLGFLF